MLESAPDTNYGIYRRAIHLVLFSTSMKNYRRFFFRAGCNSPPFFLLLALFSLYEANHSSLKFHFSSLAVGYEVIISRSGATIYPIHQRSEMCVFPVRLFYEIKYFSEFYC